MHEPLENPRLLLETAWRRIAELEVEVDRLLGIEADNVRLVKANADLEEGIIRLNKLLDELSAENAILRVELQEARGR